MSALDDHLKRHRKRIIDREAAAFREMLAAYAPVERDLARAYRELQKKIEAARAAGETISPSWFYRERRLKLLLDQVREQIARFGRRASSIVEREQREAIRIAIEQAGDVLRVMARSPDVRGIGTTLSPRAVETAVGVIGDGSPLLTYFEETLASAVAEKIKTEVIKAAAVGTDFNTIAKRLQAAGDITRQRALSMARTEVNRVRRETTRAIYQDNVDVVEGWEWVAAKSSRTCVLCLAMDGRQFKLKDEFPQHINCRCTIIPVIIDLPRPPRTIGGEWFDRQPDETKRKILGADAFDAYERGDVQLKDFVGWATSKQFGRRVYRKPLVKVLADANIAERESRLASIANPTDKLRFSVSKGRIDPAAESLAKRIGGLPSIRIEGFGDREFDAVSETAVAQTTASRAAVDNAANYLTQKRRRQIKATVDAAGRTGRTAVFEFTAGPPADAVRDYIKERAAEFGVKYRIIHPDED